jgi:prostaglandin-H2 D-isomerase / glutathione transferase
MDGLLRAAYRAVMAKPRLTYFDAPISRGEECRLALHIAGVDFEDNRLKREEWMAMKPTSPFGSVPILDLPGKPPLAQSNAILVLLGRHYNLHPKDDFEAARHEAVMAHVEDLRHQVGPTLRMNDEDKKRTREQIAANYIPMWAANLEREIADDGPFFAGNELHVVDLKLLMITRWVKGGALDHIPATSLDNAPKLNRVYNAVEAHPKVKDWYAKK